MDGSMFIDGGGNTNPNTSINASGGEHVGGVGGSGVMDVLNERAR